MKKAAILTILFLFLFTYFFNTPLCAQEEIKVNFDDTILQFDVNPKIINGRTLVPFRKIFEAFKSNVTWNNETKQIIAEKNNIIIKLKPGNKDAFKNNSKIVLDVPPTIFENRTFIPVRFISESVGAKVNWSSKEQTVFIESPDSKEPNLTAAQFQKKYNNIFDKYSTDKASYYEQLTKLEGYSLLENNTVTLKSSSDFQFVQSILDSQKILKDNFMFSFDTSEVNNLYWSSVYFSEDESFSDYFYYDFTADLINGNNKIIVNKNDFSVGAGSPDWSKIKVLKFAFESKENTEVTLSIGEVGTYNINPLCTIWFDDGWKSTFTEGFKRMSQKNPALKGEVSIISNKINEYMYMSENDLNTLVKNEWELCNHTKSHPDLTRLSNKQLENEIITCTEVLNNYQSNEGAFHLAVPYSAMNDQKLNDVIKKTCVSCRYIFEDFNTIPVKNKYKLAFKEVKNSTSPETVKEWIDTSIENNYWVILMFHRLETPCDNLYKYDPENFQQIIDYLNLKKDEIKTVTVSEAFGEMGY